ncbi:MAG: phosphatidate cytidylyltransferase [Pirellulales bacterium]|nr:phosphatidate cytidylyltransferase [Pirellulales bacterium]
MLRWRLLLGFMFVAGLAALCWLDARSTWPGAWLMPLGIVVALLAAGETVQLVAARHAAPRVALVYLGAPLVLASAWGQVFWPDTLLGPLGWSAAVLALIVVAALAYEVVCFDGCGQAVPRVASTLFAVLYSGYLLSFLAQLRLVRPGTMGVVALASVVIVVKLGDIGAYTFGRLFGRHKLAPKLSPGKTIEGLAGGLVCCCLGAWLALGPLVQATGPPGIAWGIGRWLPFGLVVGAAGVIGDLAESMLKREAGKKDSSNWMPGFGGVLDVLDSILYAAPVAWLFWVFGPAG